MATLVGLFIFCSGATINVRQVGQPLYKGAVLTILKLVIGVIIGYLLNMAFGPAGVLGLTPFAVIAAVTNSNGAIYTALAKEFGDETDMGAIAVLSLNDGPFLTMIALGTTGLASIPALDIVAAIIPLIIGMILGNLDSDFRDLLSKGLNMILPVNGFVFGANMSLITIATEPPYNDIWTIPGEAEQLEQMKKEDCDFFNSVDSMYYYHQQQIHDFLTAVRDGREPLVTAKEGRRSVELFNAIYESTRTGLPVNL